MKYRKKPIVIDAIQWDGSKKAWDKIMALGRVRWKPGEMGSETFIIETLEGDMIVRVNDFVIRGVAGEFYPCKPDIFEMTYEPVEAEPIEQEQLETCAWRVESDAFLEDERYETSCDNAFIFEIGTPRENNYVYCPSCGKLIEYTPLPAGDDSSGNSENS